MTLSRNLSLALAGCLAAATAACSTGLSSDTRLIAESDLPLPLAVPSAYDQHPLIGLREDAGTLVPLRGKNAVLKAAAQRHGLRIKGDTITAPADLESFFFALIEEVRAQMSASGTFALRRVAQRPARACRPSDMSAGLLLSALQPVPVFSCGSQPDAELQIAPLPSCSATPFCDARGAII